MGYSIKKITMHVVIVIVISFIWMLIVGELYQIFENRNYSQMSMNWLIGTIILGYIYLKYVERKGYLS
jgi:RsiW-degrading membrane proteinase PrsW (M82 family)